MKKKLSVFLSLLLALSMLAPMAVMPVFAEDDDPVTVDEYTAEETNTAVYNLNVDWKFRKAPDGSTYPLASAEEAIMDSNGKHFYDVAYDDTSWETVSIPHAINAEDSFDGLGKDRGEDKIWRGFTFYRKHITVAQEDVGKKFVAEFEAFRQSIYVYVNGHLAGFYEAGVAPVGFDLSDWIVEGDNVIAVATDNAGTVETAYGHEAGDQSGYGYEWNVTDFNEIQGGLTGNAKLHVMNKIYQTLPLYRNMKTKGNYITTDNFKLAAGKADVTVVADVRNETDAAKDITLEVVIVDKDGAVVGEFSSEQAVNVAAATDTEDDQFLNVVPADAYTDPETEKNTVSTECVETTSITATATVENLKFWSDKSPNLYTVYTYLKDGSEYIDMQKTVTGFREVKYDKDKGLQINGETTYLKGYAQRSTNEWAAIGVANDWLTDIDMQLLKESNANFIRWMHIAPNPVDIRAGDKYGVISICPAGDKETDVADRKWDQRLETMRDVLIYFRNSPSIIFWEAGNDKITDEHMKAMYDLKQELDPDGGRFMGCRSATTAAQPLDWCEWVGTIIHRQDSNMYGTMGANNKYIPMVETEYHRQESPRRAWDRYSPPYYDYINKWLGANGSKTDGFDIWDQTQEDMSQSMLNTGDGYSYFFDNRVGGSGTNYYSGAAMMVWSDSNMHVRNCGVENARTSGRVDPIRIKKENFYAIQAVQSEEPAVHILGHWNYPDYDPDATREEGGTYYYEDRSWTGSYWKYNGNWLRRDPRKKTVYVIGSSNLAKVELYINDVLQATKTTPKDNYIYAFDNIDVTQHGSIKAIAYDEKGGTVEHEIKTAGEAAAIRLTPVKGPKGLLADGSDLMYVDVEVIDAEGNVCPLDDRKISFTISDESKAKFIGGYNSGYYSDRLEGAGGRIVNHKDYVFAENGVNRVFIQATRDSGEFTLTATTAGMQPVPLTLESVPVTVEGGLMSDEQQSFAQGEVPEAPKPQSAPALKALGEVFEADWDETDGNVYKVNEDDKDYYTVKVGSTTVEFTDKPYKPDSSTGVVAEITPILEALKDAGVDLTYTFDTDGPLPSYGWGEPPYLTITAGGKKIEARTRATDLFINEEQGGTLNFQFGPNSTGTTIIGEIVPVIAEIAGISSDTDLETKTLTFTVDSSPQTASISLASVDKSYPAALAYSDGKVTVASTAKLENANLIFAGYTAGKALGKIAIHRVSVEANASSQPVEIDADVKNLENVKAFLWDADLKKAEPIAAALECPIPVYKVDGVYKYDTVASINNCNTLPDFNNELGTIELSSDNGPDGTKYIKNIDYDPLNGRGEKSGRGLCFDGLSANSMADIMWEIDVRFDQNGGGVTPYDKGDAKLGTCIRRNDYGGKSYIAVQTGGSSFTRYEEIDPAAWYHVVLIGRYSSPADARTDLIVYKYNGSEKELIGTHKGVNQRNLSANNGGGAQHWNAHVGTSVDNPKITILGADTLKVTSDAAEITAGNTMQFAYSATRQGEYFANPAAKWEIYNEDNTEKLNDANITISDQGILSVGLQVDAKKINVRVTATDSIYNSEVFASKLIDVKAVDISNVKFDTLSLKAEGDRDYVQSGSPLKINVTATKDSSPVDLTDDDLIWYVTDKTDMMKLGDNLKWIKIEKGVVTVDPKAVSQDITIRAADPDDKVRGSIALHIKSSDALEGNEDGDKDRLLTANNCESAIDTAKQVESIDGTHAYEATAGFQICPITETTGDIVVEMDIKFNQEGAGFQPAKNGKVNTCVIYHSGNISIQTGGSDYTSLIGSASTDKWYHVTLIRRQGAYAHMTIEEYNAQGERTNKQTFKDVNQRNDEATAFININAGTTVDNVRILTPNPTNISLSLDETTVFAGSTINAIPKLEWNGLEMKGSDIIEYKIYDGDNENLLDGNQITVSNNVISVDAMTDPQEVYVRAVVKTRPDMYASAKFEVKSSDILLIKQLGVSEENEKRLVNLKVEKAFFYNEEVTFVTEVFDENGVLTNTYLKSMAGSALKIGDNTVSLGIDLPSDFDKTTDTIKIYAVTKVSEDTPTASDSKLTAVKAAGGATITLPTGADKYDDNAKVAVLVIKATADETDVKAEDILYYDQVAGTETTVNAKWSQNYTGDFIVKTGGTVSGAHTVKATAN